MKIKTKKKMYIGELLEYVRKDDLRGRYFRVMNESRYIKVTPDGDIYFDADFRFKPDDTFTVGVEEELTEETEFDELWEVYYHKSNGEMDTYKNCETYGVYSTSISQILKENSIDGDNITLAIYYGSTLIWTKESGIPESGVLEVD